MTSSPRPLARVLLAASAALLLLLGGISSAQGAPRSVDLAFRVSDSAPRKGEMVWLTGRVTRADAPVRGAKVVVERRASAGKAWSRVATTKTSTTGTFSVRQRPAKGYSYRARVVASSTVRARTGAVRTITFSTGARTLSARASLLGSRLGAASSGYRSTKVDGVGTVTYRSYAKGMLVKVGSASRARSWLVYGDIRRAYAAAKGPRGVLGAPLADPKCGLIESGCVQRFTGGSVYDNKNTRTATIVLGAGRKTEVLAAAKSQVGYEQKSHNWSKYNQWTGMRNAWCSVFQTWSAAASGNPSVLPQRATFAGFMSQIHRTMKTGSTPKVGALVFFDTIDGDGSNAATHVGLVLKVKKGSIVTFEGNTSNPAGGGARGVYQKERPRSMPLYYAYPVYG